MSDNFELLDKLDELEKENEELKKIISDYENKAVSATILKDEMRIKGLEAQIEKMKCCGNCKHCILEGVLYCTIKNRDVGNRACNYWELAE